MRARERARMSTGIDYEYKRDNNGRAYKLEWTGETYKRLYGYSTHFTGAYVCFTDGHLCECGEEL